MKEFNLSEWLKDKSRKVVTRSGHEVCILYTHQRGNMPIVALVKFETLDGVQIFYTDGKNESHREYDLFFADEEEELTEFEKELQIIISEASHWTSDDGSISTYCQFGDKEIKRISEQLLDLARKEIQKDNVIIDKDRYLKICDQYYNNGKKDALKSLPKFKKGTPPSATTLYLIRKGYYMPLKEVDELFETLPKEE